MRDPKEKKEKVTSIRLSEEQYQRVKKQAEQHGMTMSNYIITNAVHGENLLTPEQVVRLQNIVNEAVGVVMEYAPEALKDKRIWKIRREMSKLWTSLK